jgi:hypothetical protein
MSEIALERQRAQRRPVVELHPDGVGNRCSLALPLEPHDQVDEVLTQPGLVDAVVVLAGSAC